MVLYDNGLIQAYAEENRFFIDTCLRSRSDSNKTRKFNFMTLIVRARPKHHSCYTTDPYVVECASIKTLIYYVSKSCYLSFDTCLSVVNQPIVFQLPWDRVCLVKQFTAKLLWMNEINNNGLVSNADEDFGAQPNHSTARTLSCARKVVKLCHLSYWILPPEVPRGNIV